MLAQYGLYPPLCYVLWGVSRQHMSIGNAYFYICVEWPRRCSYMDVATGDVQLKSSWVKERLLLRYAKCVMIAVNIVYVNHL